MFYGISCDRLSINRITLQITYYNISDSEQVQIHLHFFIFQELINNYQTLNGICFLGNKDVLCCIRIWRKLPRGEWKVLILNSALNFYNRFKNISMRKKAGDRTTGIEIIRKWTHQCLVTEPPLHPSNRAHKTDITAPSKNIRVPQVHLSVTKLHIYTTCVP